MIAIIGAGISGLSLAYYLKKMGKDFMLFEKSSTGGVIRTKLDNGRVFDLGANSLILNKDAEQLITDLKLESKLVEAHESSKNRFIIHQGQLIQLPSRPQDILKTSMITWKAKFRIFREILGLFKKTKKENETVAEFFERHFGKEITEKLVYAFVNGIYSLNPEELDLELTFPRLQELENKYGSILKGFIKEKSLDRMKSVNFENGFSTLITALNNQVKAQLLQAEVLGIERNADRYQIKYSTDEGEKKLYFDKVVFCSDLKSTEKLINHLSLGVQQYFKATKVLTINTINLVYKKSAVKKSINGFGALGTLDSQINFSGVINVSQTFPTKLNNEDEVMFTVMIKGKQAGSNDEELIHVAHEQLSKLLNISEFPISKELTRWRGGLPEYNKELKILNQELPKFRSNNIFFNANWVQGLSIKDCISKSKEISTLL